MRVHRLSRMLLLALLMTSAVLLVAEDAPAEDDVDRTDFTEAHLKEDEPAQGPTGPSEDIEAVSLLPDLLEESKVPVGTSNQLLVSLANLGSRMFNVSHIVGSLSDPETGKKVASFKKKVFGDPLPPREQRSFVYTFMPKAESKLGEYQLSFTAYYSAGKGLDPFLDVVYNETIELVPKPVEPDETMLYVAVGGGAGLLILVLGYLMMGGSKKAPASPTKKAAAKATSGGEDTSEWLAGTLAGTEGKRRGAKKKL